MTRNDVVVHGSAAPGFGGVVDAFRSNFRDHDELGAAVAVYLEGELVVDVWAGIADVSTGRAWTADTSGIMFSCTKGLMAICVYLLVQAGKLDPDAPVSSYWPEFAQGGKSEITVRCALSHRAGLMALDARLTREQVLAWTPVIHALECQRPLWDPGTAFCYHAVTYGFIAGELIRRVSGLMPREYLAQEISHPLGIGTSVGLPACRQGMVAKLEPPLPAPPNELGELFAAWFAASEVAQRAMSIGELSDGTQEMAIPFNDPDVRAAQLPAVNGISTARDLAKLYAATVTRLLTPASVADATLVQSSGKPWIGPEIDNDLRWGTGFEVGDANRLMLSENSFGHDGAGGQLGFADDALQVGFGYMNNRMGAFPEERANFLTQALKRCLGM